MSTQPPPHWDGIRVREGARTTIGSSRVVTAAFRWERGKFSWISARVLWVDYAAGWIVGSDRGDTRAVGSGMCATDAATPQTFKSKGW